MYVDDTLGISHDSRTLLEFIKNKERIKFKNDRIAEPDVLRRKITEKENNWK